MITVFLRSASQVRMILQVLYLKMQEIPALPIVELSATFTLHTASNITLLGAGRVKLLTKTCGGLYEHS